MPLKRSDLTPVTVYLSPDDLKVLDSIVAAERVAGSISGRATVLRRTFRRRQALLDEVGVLKTRISVLEALSTPPEPPPSPVMPYKPSYGYQKPGGVEGSDRGAVYE